MRRPLGYESQSVCMQVFLNEMFLIFLLAGWCGVVVYFSRQGVPHYLARKRTASERARPPDILFRQMMHLNVRACSYRLMNAIVCARVCVWHSASRFIKQDCMEFMA